MSKIWLIAMTALLWAVHPWLGAGYFILRMITWDSTDYSVGEDKPMTEEERAKYEFEAELESYCMDRDNEYYY